MKQKHYVILIMFLISGYGEQNESLCKNDLYGGKNVNYYLIESYPLAQWEDFKLYIGEEILSYEEILILLKNSGLWECMDAWVSGLCRIRAVKKNLFSGHYVLLSVNYNTSGNWLHTRLIAIEEGFVVFDRDFRSSASDVIEWVNGLELAYKIGKSHFSIFEFGKSDMGGDVL